MRCKVSIRMDAVSTNANLELLTAGIRLWYGSDLVCAPVANWLEVRTPTSTHSPIFRLDGQALVTEVDDLHLTVQCRDDAGPYAPLVQLSFRLENTGDTPRSCNLKWTLPLGAQDVSRWLIPALLYNENRQQYDGGLPSLVGKPSLEKSRSPWWVFRADLTAVPMVMAWTGAYSVAMIMEERSAGHMTGIGLDHRAGRRALIGTWPYREEPRQRAVARPGQDTLQPVITYASVAPGEVLTVSCWLAIGPPAPHAYAPILREMFSRWDARFPLHPWYPTADGAAHAAYGLYTWHYDPEEGALWETCTYDGYYGKNSRQVDRFEMHTGFVSGIPYAHALRQYGLRHDRPEMAEAGRRVIDLCCSHLTPWGTFWAKYARDEGWTTGWPSPQRAGAQPDMGSASGELQARTLAEATLFAARAALAEPDKEMRQHWTEAVCHNLDFVLAVLREDGNPGEAYSSLDGSVLDWDGEAGLHWISALVEGSRLTGDDRYLTGAIRIGAYFRPAVADAYLTGAPEGMHLLPTSEDPQNAVIAYMLLWEATADPCWLETARQAADLLMTFRWQYNTEFPAMTVLERYDYRTKGMDISSPNNVHLHPYGLIAVPELVRLWEVTGDEYILKQTRNNLLACHQMLASADGVFDARRGMMSERWHQTPNDIPKGGTLQLSHAWAVGLVLFADLWIREYGQLLVDGVTGELVALEAVSLERIGDAWHVHNPWSRAIEARVVVREAHGTLACGVHTMRVQEPLLRVPLVIPPGETIIISWQPAGRICPSV